MGIDHVNTHDLRVGIEMTMTRDEILAARASDVPLTRTVAHVRAVALKAIIRDVTAELGFEAGELDRRCRKRQQQAARAALAGALHRHTGQTWPEIARLLGFKSPHTAVIHGRERHRRLHKRVSRLVAASPHLEDACTIDPHQGAA